MCVRDCIKQWNVHSLFELSPGWFALFRAAVWEQKQQTFDELKTPITDEPRRWETPTPEQQTDAFQHVIAWSTVSIRSTRFFCWSSDVLLTRRVSLLTPAGHWRLYSSWRTEHNVIQVHNCVSQPAKQFRTSLKY